MPILEKLARPIAIIAIGAAAVIAAPTFASAASMSAEREIGKTGWHGGFEITVDDVTAKTEDGTTKVDVELSYKNLVGVTHSAPDKAYLELNGGEVVDISFNNPKIAGFGKGKGAATASLGSTDGDLEDVLDNVVLVYGEADGNLTKIPFAEKGKVDSIEPKGIPVGQTIGDVVTVELNKAYLWPSYQAGDKGRYELWVELTMVSSPDVSYSYNVYPANFSITSPRGKSDSADSRSPWKGDLLGKQHPIDGKWLIFLIDAPAKGDYTFGVSMDSNPKVPKDKVDVSAKITL